MPNDNIKNIIDYLIFNTKFTNTQFGIQPWYYNCGQEKITMSALKTVNIKMAFYGQFEWLCYYR